MRMRKPGWPTVLTVLVGVAALAMVSPDHQAHSPNPTAQATANTGRPSVAAPTPGTTASPPPPSTSAGSATTTTPPVGPPTCASIMATMTSRQRLAQLVMVGVDPAKPDDALNMVTGEKVGGLFIGSDATGLLSDGAIARAKKASRIPLFVAIDEEGGRVQRIVGPHGKVPSARTMAATMSAPQVRALATSMGSELRGLGVNVDFAPDADVSSQPDDAVIGDRSFSTNPQVVISYAGAFATGLRSTGVLPVFKHFPGHGRAVGDSHTGSAVDPPLASLRTDDLIPYQTLTRSGPAAVMVGHLEVPGLTGTTPASLSPAAYQLLRGSYHFDGVAFTDDLGAMAAVTDHYDLPDAVLTAISSGADVALWTSGSQLSPVLDRMAAAVTKGALPQARVNQSVTRILIAKGLCTH
jgi:beta-N-acetylhexosaminidase